MTSPPGPGSRPLISVVTPTFNRLEWVARRMRMRHLVRSVVSAAPPMATALAVRTLRRCAWPGVLSLGWWRAAGSVTRRWLRR